MGHTDCYCQGECHFGNLKIAVAFFSVKTRHLLVCIVKIVLYFFLSFFVGRGADVNAKDYKGCTPLRLARRYGQDDIETMLTKKGAKDEQDPPSRKQSIGPDPPWMVSSRKSSAVTPSRREGLSIGAN